MQLDNIDKDSKIIISSGCSYSNVFNILKPKLESFNIVSIRAGEAGRSNKWIMNSLIYTLEQLKDHPKENIFVTGILSSVDRQDLIVDKISNESHHRLNYEEFTDERFFSNLLSFRQYKWYSHVLSYDHTYEPKRKTGLLSMTNLNKNIDSEFFFEQFAGMYYKYFYTKLGVFENTLMSILSLQSYCKLNGIKYLIMPWQDIFYDTSFQPFFMVGQAFHPSYDKRTHICKYHKMEKRIDTYPELRYLYDQIDFENWWLNKTARCESGGMADWAIENGPGLFGTADDNIHLTDIGYHRFIDQVLVPLINQKTGWLTR